MLSIRAATSEDAEVIFQFIVDLAIYEKAEQQVKTTVEEIRSTLFDPKTNTSALICLLDDQPIGYAVYFLNYSTWLGKSGLYLEDLYVSPLARGKGAGLALMKTLAKTAASKGYGRFEWSVLDWNTPAIDFYDSIGAKPQNEWIGYRLEGKALLAFGNSAK